MQAEIARHPAAAAGGLGQDARELVANVQLGGQAGIGPADLARLWDRVEGGLVGLREATRINHPVVGGPPPLLVGDDGVRLRDAADHYPDPHPLSPPPLSAAAARRPRR